MVTKYKFYTKEDDAIRRIHADLATEIGFNESIVLMQIDHLINVDNNDKIYNGKYWTYDSVKKLKEKYFPFWGVTTIKKAITSLIKQKLIVVDNHNKAKFDKTNWYTIDYEQASKLKSILIGYKDNKGSVHALVGKWPTRGHNPANGKSESGQPIPKNSPETSSKTSTLRTADCKQSDDVGGNVSMYSIQENPFLKELKKILENKKYEKLKNTKNKNIGDINKFNRRQIRKGATFQNEEIFAALKLYNELDCEQHPLLCEYVEHETKLWDFTKTKNPQSVKAQFILECLYCAPIFIHFCKLRKNGDLAEELRYNTCELENNDEKTMLEMWREG